jgi:hypothetical protein
MARSIGRLDRAAEERPWLTGLAVGVPAGIVLAIMFRLLDGAGFADPGGLLVSGLVQGLVIAVLVAGGGSWRRRWREDQRRAVQGRDGDGPAEEGRADG